MKIDHEQLEVGKEYLAVDAKDSRNEVGVRVLQMADGAGWIQVVFTRGLWRNAFKEYPRGSELAIHVRSTEFFEFPSIPFKQCAACKYPIIFLVTEAGKKIPVNFETVLPKDRKFVPRYHVAHFATCPQASQFRNQHGKEKAATASTTNGSATKRPTASRSVRKPARNDAKRV